MYVKYRYNEHTGRFSVEIGEHWSLHMANGRDLVIWARWQTPAGPYEIGTLTPKGSDERNADMLKALMGTAVWNFHRGVTNIPLPRFHRRLRLRYEMDPDAAALVQAAWEDRVLAVVRDRRSAWPSRF
ncbi:hypothetical protein HJC99_00740 [Candidatus Saccharibacteria bacterium]|nr:hypothetical protein [Candidatus Saccharibacteria bacterium]